MLAPKYLYKATWYIGENSPKRDVYVKRIKHKHFRMPDGSWLYRKDKITAWVLADNILDAQFYVKYVATNTDPRYLKEGYYAGPNFAGGPYWSITRCRILFLTRVALYNKAKRDRERYS